MGDRTDLSSLKIVDFGLSAQFEPNASLKYLSKYCGTIPYMAPEIFAHKIYSKVLAYLHLTAF